MMINGEIQADSDPGVPGGIQEAVSIRDRGKARRVLAPLLNAEGVARWLLVVGGALVLLFIILAIFAPLIAPYGFDQYESGGVRFPMLAAPSAQHLFGTTDNFTDVFSIVVYGSRTALEVVLLAVALSLLIGVPLGLISGYIGGFLDRVTVLVMDALFAFPYLLLAIVVAFLLSNSVGAGILSAAFAITVVYIPQYFRVVRNSVISVKQEPYVEAARALGAGPLTVIRRYITANVIQSVPVIATLNAADAILTLAGLGFLGYGIQPSQGAEWGYQLQAAIPDIGDGIWWTAVFPGLAIVLLVGGLTLFGEGLNDVVNPALRAPSRKRLVMWPGEDQ